MLRFYRVDLLDFYRGDLSARRLGVLVRQLPSGAALSRSLNDGNAPWTNTDHRIADLWSLWAKKEHPIRAEMVAKARAAKKRARVVQLRGRFESLKRTYGLG